MPNLLQLSYEELIAPSRDYKKVLLPDEIPLHPTVYHADFAYTMEFAREVMSALPESIERDVTSIEKMLGTDIKIKVTGTALHSDSEYAFAFDLGDVNFYANPERKSIDLDYGSANIAMYADMSEAILRHIYPIQNHPMNQARIQEYAFSHEHGSIQNIMWYTHNIQDAAMPLRLIFRNFAIIFNNLGLQKLQEKKFRSKQ